MRRLKIVVYFLILGILSSLLGNVSFAWASTQDKLVITEIYDLDLASAPLMFPVGSHHFQETIQAYSDCPLYAVCENENESTELIPSYDTRSVDVQKEGIYEMTMTLQYDKEMNEYEKTTSILYLMFSDEYGELRDHPQHHELNECISWYLNGWYHDNTGSSKNTKRFIDYDVDQWRIYADFLQIYGIDLSVADMHWWKFNGLIWNMPRRLSSLMEVIEIRQKKIEKNMSSKEKDAIRNAQNKYALEQPEKEYTSEEKEKIDDYDRMMEEIRKQKETEQEALKQFKK